MKRIPQIIGFLLLAVGLALGFQNCGSYTPDSSLLYGSGVSTSTCTAAECPSESDGIELKLGSYDVVSVTKPSDGLMPSSCDGNNSRCIDIAGYCEMAGFEDSYFTVELQGVTGFVQTPATAKCDDNGRFRILVQLPANYNFDSIHTLIVKVQGLDPSTGALTDNARLLNRKSVTLTSSTL